MPSVVGTTDLSLRSAPISTSVTFCLATYLQLNCKMAPILDQAVGYGVVIGIGTFGLKLESRGAADAKARRRLLLLGADGAPHQDPGELMVIAFDRFSR